MAPGTVHSCKRLSGRTLDHDKQHTFKHRKIKKLLFLYGRLSKHNEILKEHEYFEHDQGHRYTLHNKLLFLFQICFEKLPTLYRVRIVNLLSACHKKLPAHGSLLVVELPAQNHDLKNVTASQLFTRLTCPYLLDWIYALNLNVRFYTLPVHRQEKSRHYLCVLNIRIIALMSCFVKHFLTHLSAAVSRFNKRETTYVSAVSAS